MSDNASQIAREVANALSNVSVLQPLEVYGLAGALAGLLPGITALLPARAAQVAETAEALDAYAGDGDGDGDGPALGTDNVVEIRDWLNVLAQELELAEAAARPKEAA